MEEPIRISGPDAGRGVHARAELRVAIRNADVDVDRTVLVVDLLSDHRDRAAERLVVEAADAELDLITDHQMRQILLIGRQAEHHFALVDNLAQRLPHVEVAADIHLHVGGIAADRGLDLQEGNDARRQQAGRIDAQQRKLCRSGLHAAAHREVLGTALLVAFLRGGLLARKGLLAEVLRTQVLILGMAVEVGLLQGDELGILERRQRLVLPDVGPRKQRRAADRSAHGQRHRGPVLRRKYQNAVEERLVGNRRGSRGGIDGRRIGVGCGSGCRCGGRIGRSRRRFRSSRLRRGRRGGGTRIRAGPEQQGQGKKYLFHNDDN